MKVRTGIAGLTMVLVGLVAPIATTAVSAEAASTGHSIDQTARHKCTKTSGGHCIKGGQFCPKAKYKKSGWDAKGRRYVCKGSRSHPHWMKP